MEVHNDELQGIFNILPQELLGEILRRIDFFDLRQLDATNTYWRQLIKKHQLWLYYYKEMMSTDTVHNLAMNYVWMCEDERTKQLSTLLDTHRERQMSPRVAEYITPHYKSYIKAIIKNKTNIYKDLQLIHTNEVLTADERQLALKLYWLVHQRLPALVIDLIPRDKVWNNLKYSLTENMQLSMAANDQTRDPALYWEDHVGERYYYNLALWINKDTITLYTAHWEQWGDPDVMQHLTITGSFDVIRDQFPMHMLYDYIPTGESIHFLRGWTGMNGPLFSERQVLYHAMSTELNWKLDQAALTIITTVNRSMHITDRELKLTCDHWSPDGNFNARSKHPKPAVVRCMRRLIYMLLKKEIAQFSTSRVPVFMNNKGAVKFGENYPSEWSVHATHPEYWPLFLIEKAYYCCEPLSQLILSLVLRKEWDKVLFTDAFAALKVDPLALEDVISCFPSNASNS